MYCRDCERSIRQGLRPVTDCPDCRRLRTERPFRCEQIPLVIPKGNSAPKPASQAMWQTAPQTDRFRGHPVCSECHRILAPQDAHRAEERIFCPDCFRALPICRNCGERVISPSGGSVLCPACRRNATCCEKCGTVLLESELYECDGHFFCEGCYDQLEECENCENKMFLYDENAVTLLCRECLESFIACEVCGAVVPLEDVCSAEGHALCPECMSECDECEDCGVSVFAMSGEAHPRLCAKCLENYVLCEACGDPIPRADAGHYIVDGAVLCENCYDDLPECEECLTHFFPAADEERGLTVCRRCREQFTHCDSCGVRLAFTEGYAAADRLLCAVCLRKAIDQEPS